jgi:RNA polymerase sigma factor (sigma-70 family)
LEGFFSLEFWRGFGNDLQPIQMPDLRPITQHLSAPPREFRTTHWSVVLAAGADSENAHAALEKLCHAYWYPIYGFVRWRGYDEHQSKDLTQEFFARLLTGDSLQSVSPERGKFRTFLLAAVKNFLANDWRDSQRLKRGGGKEFLSWDNLDAEQRFTHEPTEDTSAESWFDRRWAQALVSSALKRLGDEMDRDGVKQRFDVLKVFLQGDGGDISYAEAAQRVGLSEPATKTAIFRLRRRYGELIREEVAATVGNSGDVEAEIQHLIQVLASA